MATLSPFRANITARRDARSLVKKRWRKALVASLVAGMHRRRSIEHSLDGPGSGAVGVLMRRPESGPLPHPPDEDAPKLATNMQTWFNINNVYIGLGLLSIPYALAMTGWIGVALLIVTVMVCNYTGKTIVTAFTVAAHKLAERHNDLSVQPVRSRETCSYPGVGRAAFGAVGEYAVLLFVAFEFFGGLAMCIVFLWTNLWHLVPQSWDKFAVAMVAMAVVLPTVWIKRFSELTFISMLGLTSSSLIALTVLGIAIYSAVTGVDTGAQHQLVTSVGGIGIGMGIFVTSLAGQACLPSLYNTMLKRKSYNAVLNWSFITMSMVYGIMCISGYVRYGSSTQVLITSSLHASPGGVVPKIAVALVVASCSCTVAPINAVLTEMVEGKAGITRPLSVRVTRTLVLALATALAWFAKDNLNNLESLIGGIGSLMTSLVLPCAFYMKLCWEDLGVFERAGNVLIVVVAAALGVFVVGSNVHSVLQSFE